MGSHKHREKYNQLARAVNPAALAPMPVTHHNGAHAVQPTPVKPLKNGPHFAMTPNMPGEKTRNILEHLTTAVICLDENLMLTYLNPACEMLFGVSSRHVEDLPLVQALPQFAEQEPRLKEAQQEGLAYTEREMGLSTTDGRLRTVDCSVTPYMSHYGTRGLLLELHNLDRHRRISRDDQMLSQHATNRQVVRGLAHEIKNPLGGLRGAAQLLEAELADPELAEYTGIIIREADRLQDMVDRLLGPNQPPQKASINIHAPLEHVRQLVKAELTNGIALTRDYDPSLPDLLADEDQLTQVFLNILRNAVQAMGDQSGEIKLRTRAVRRFTIGGVNHRLVLRVDISDNGPGIEPDMLEQVFYPLITSRPDGNGLGLSIAQSLVQAHGGLIECQSEPGHTVFSIFLPLGT